MKKIFIKTCISFLIFIYLFDTYSLCDDIDNDYDYKYSEGGSNPGAFAEDDIPVYDLVPEGTIINGHVVRRPAS